MYDICCMSNHVHELYRVPEDGVTIAQILQRVKGGFARKFNPRYSRTGHFWKNKPFWRIVEDERYVLHCCNYYHWNPVKAGMVDHPADWPYSGYRFHVLGEKEGMIGELLTPLFETQAERMRHQNNTEIEKNTLKAIKKMSNRFIGGPGFSEKIRTR